MSGSPVGGPTVPGGSLLARLQALPHPVTGENVKDVHLVTQDLSEALHFLGRESDGRPSAVLSHWREYFGVPEQKLYYCNNEIAYNSWEAPPCFQFREWALDAQLHGIPLPLARELYQTLDYFLTAHPPAVVYKALGVLSKLVGNVADCGNSVERFRSVKVDNPRFREAVWDVPGASQVLFLVGFRQQGGVVSLPADAPLGPLQAAAARLRRLADRKGHSGQAEAVQPDGADGSGRPPSDLYGSPGFRYQEQIWHCSCCDHPINDGSERLWTGAHDAPLGEYRYQCTTCQEAGATFNLCQACWDRFQEQQQRAAAASSSGGGGGGRGAGASGSGAGGGGGGGQPLHASNHAFQHIGPRLTRHNDYYGASRGGSSTDPSNPWGNRAAGGASARRALQRLGERYGIRHWG